MNSTTSNQALCAAIGHHWLPWGPWMPNVRSVKFGMIDVLKPDPVAKWRVRVCQQCAHEEIDRGEMRTTTESI
jgi:hypothetical protein